MKLIPLQQNKELLFYAIELDDVEIKLTIPLFESRISAGFPSPATDYIELALDFNSYLVSKPYTTFAVIVTGDSMRDANIRANDALVVDRSITPVSGKIVVAILNGEFTVKTLSILNNKYYLVPENPNYKTIEVKPEDEFEIWGIVTFIIHKAP